MTAKDRADERFSLLVRARDRACQECGTPGQMNADRLPVIGLDCAHIISRRFSPTRVDQANAVALCRRCHSYFGEHRFEWENWCIARIGYQAWEELVSRAHDLSIRPDWGLEAMRLGVELKSLQAVA